MQKSVDDNCHREGRHNGEIQNVMKTAETHRRYHSGFHENPERKIDEKNNVGNREHKMSAKTG